MESVQLRLRLAGHRGYEPPISLPPGDLPHIGELIEVPLPDRIVRAQVTSTTPPICRGGDVVTYLVFATEPEQ